MKLFFNCFLFFLITISSCSKKEQSDDYLRGKLRLYTDPAFEPIVRAESNLFQHFYKESSIISSQVPQDSAIGQLLNSNADIIAVSRKLNDGEKAFLAQKNIHPEEYPIAEDALVFITSNQRKDSILSVQQLQSIFAGKITNWQESGSSPSDLFVVFNQRKSADLDYLSNRLNLSPQLKVFVAGSYEKVVDYVKNHPNALGVINLSYLRNILKDKKVKNTIRFMTIKAEDGKLTYPFQSDLASGDYPFKRTIYLITKFKTGLGTGFVSYVLTEDGQRVVLKAGLLPIKMPGREIIINKE